MAAQSIYRTEHEADAVDDEHGVDRFEDEREGMVTDGMVATPSSPFMAKFKRYAIGGVIVVIAVIVLSVVVGGGDGGDSTSKSSQQQTENLSEPGGTVPAPAPVPTVPAPAPVPTIPAPIPVPVPAPTVPDDYYSDSITPSLFPSESPSGGGKYLDYCYSEFSWINHEPHGERSLRSSDLEGSHVNHDKREP